MTDRRMLKQWRKFSERERDKERVILDKKYFATTTSLKKRSMAKRLLRYTTLVVKMTMINFVLLLSRGEGGRWLTMYQP